MKTTCTTAPIFSHVGQDEGIRLIAKAGYERLDFSLGPLTKDDSIWSGDGYREEARRVRALCDANGVDVGQTHAPFMFHWSDLDECENKALPRTIRSLEIAGILGAPIAIVHPIHHLSYAEYGGMLYEKNLQFYRYLLPYAKRYNVKIALENMFQFDQFGVSVPDVYADVNEFKRALDDLNDPMFCACVDVGHCGLGRLSGAGEMLRALGGYVQALHLHDNDNVRDTHTIPFLGTLDWDDICAALRDIHYQGDLCMEVLGNYYKRFTDPELLEKAIHFANDIGRYLAGKIEG